MIQMANSSPDRDKESRSYTAGYEKLFCGYILHLMSNITLYCVIPLSHTGPESHELTNIWIRG